MKSHDFLKFCQAFLSIFVVEVFSVAQITSFSIISEYAADRDTLKFAADHPVKIYFFGNNLETIVALSFSRRPKKYLKDCDDDRFGESLKVTNSGTGIMMSVFSLPSDNCPRMLSICSKQLNKNGSLSWIHEEPIFPKYLSCETDGFNISGPLAWVLYGFMLTQSALFSGLNLGIMTLDVLTLKIMQQAGSPSEKKMADSVLPVRARGNLILCSLTMANVVVNVIISMLSDRLIGGTGWAIFYASIGILIFGEIIPQAICNRYSLLVASKTIPFTKFILYLTLPVAYPLSLVLDTILGEDMGKTFTRAKLAELIKQHGNLGFVDKDEVNIITGALSMNHRTVKEIMTPIDDVYMLSSKAVLDFETTNDIIAHGFTRIPIFENDRRRVKSVLNVKDLAFVDPNDKIPVSTICNFYKRTFITVPASKTLTDIFDEFRKGNTHLALVYADSPKSDLNANSNRLIGIVTMEDVIEEIMQEEIVDETDIFTDNKRKKKRSMRCPNMDLWPILNFQTGSRITPQLKIAVLRHLVANTIAFGPKYAHTLILQGFLNCSFAKEVMSDDTQSRSPALYEAGKESTNAIFTLQGSLIVEFPDTHLQFEAGAFTLFGEAMLANVNETFPVLPDEWNLEALLQTLGDKAKFTPDFNTQVTSDVLFLEVTAEKYLLIRYLSQKIQGGKFPLVF
uniref:Metal transporter CNNM4 n=4 Tax=Schistocephalus solidus TaxID=70667 RepID=A0A0X3NZF4_SCHSO